MLLCNEAFVEGKKPQKIKCKKTGSICVHVRYCAVSMKYYQTDNAKECVMRCNDGKNNETSQDDQFRI